MAKAGDMSQAATPAFSGSPPWAERSRADPATVPASRPSAQNMTRPSPRPAKLAG